MKTIKLLTVLFLILGLNANCQRNQDGSTTGKNPTSNSGETVQSKAQIKIEIKHGTNLPDGKPGYTILLSGLNKGCEISITAIDSVGSRIALIPESDPVFADKDGKMVIDVHYGVKNMLPGTCLFMILLNKSDLHSVTTKMPVVIPPTKTNKNWVLKF